MMPAIPASALLRPAVWPSGCGALMTTRQGGASRPPFDRLNLQAPDPSTGFEDAAVVENQRRLAATLGAVPVFLHQVHGTEVVRLGAADARPGAAMHRADASICTEPGVACVVRSADCLPVLFAARDGSVVGAAHAGWRGLAAGVLEATVAALRAASRSPEAELVAWLGACIGPGRFEVGDEVKAAFPEDDAAYFRADTGSASAPKWHADLQGLAGIRLRRLGVVAIETLDACTATDEARFFSYRRDGPTGRMAAAAWIRGD